jgi:hypothetical protein
MASRLPQAEQLAVCLFGQPSRPIARVEASSHVIHKANVRLRRTYCAISFYLTHFPNTLALTFCTHVIDSIRISMARTL